MSIPPRKEAHLTPDGCRAEWALQGSSIGREPGRWSWLGVEEMDKGFSLRDDKGAVLQTAAMAAQP